MSSGLPANHVPRLRFRTLHSRDLSECLALVPSHLGLAPAQLAGLPALWGRLIHEPSVISGVMEDSALPFGQRIQAWGVTIVLPQAMVRELALDTAPRAYVSRRVYEALLSGRLVPMTDREIGLDNARGGVVLMVLHYSMRHTDLNDPYLHKVVASANDTFRVFHDGYQLRALYYENSVAAEPIALSSGFDLRPLADADQLRGLVPALQPALYALTREDARKRLPGPPARNSFEHQPPRFRFSATQRKLLWHALFDDSDEALLPVLEVSTHGLKKLWRGIYERIGDVEPEFFLARR
ncbi:MAG: hypothetical protein ABI671_07915 [Burkholderiales bacterium]